MSVGQQLVQVRRDNFADMRFTKCANKCRHKLAIHGPYQCLVDGCPCPMFQVKGVTPDRNAPDQRPWQFCPKGHRLGRMTDAELRRDMDAGVKFECHACHRVYFKDKESRKKDEEPTATVSAASGES